MPNLIRKLPRRQLVLVWTAMLLGLLVSNITLADGPADNHPEKVRRVPKLGIVVSEAQRANLESRLERLSKELASVSDHPLLPDAKIFHKAVHDALTHQEFFAKRDVETALRLLDIGDQRARELQQDKPSWVTATGLVVRGYRSKIDGSVQPYGLVIPDTFRAELPRRHRLDLWFHGRGETMSEVKFIDQRLKQVGQYAPRSAFVLHPYGRYSNAFKFAGEVDVLEALQHAQQHYPIDRQRISVRGFSMGGAACWQFAVHYADRWFAANPGAGFSETPRFLKFFQKETLQPTWWEKRLWHWYDCTDYAINLNHCPTVAYSGELDIQKQAADVMEEALAKEGMRLVHIIGPKTKHRIHADSKKIIESKLYSLASRGRERFPHRVRFATYTLKYNRMHWVTIDALQEHWQRAEIEATIVNDHKIRVTAKNVRQLTLSMPPGWCPLDLTQSPVVEINGQEVRAIGPKSDRSWWFAVHLQGDKWRRGPQPKTPLVKRHHLQGPIDDAFMDSFIFVAPSGKSPHAAVSRWAAAELSHAQTHWRRQFRGDARIKTDQQVSAADIANSNLVLFGDPSSNQILAKIADKLPIRWSKSAIQVGNKSYDAEHHAAIAIYPNPLNPKRYVVLNSGFTYREFAYLNNARQVPMLPDWAIVDLRQPPTSQYPGKIVDANFFDESWQLKPAGTK